MPHLPLHGASRQVARAPAAVLCVALMLWAAPLRAQRPVRLDEAVGAALLVGTDASVGRADTLAAAALVMMARAWQNPSLAAAYTKDPPQYHVTIDVPLDLATLRHLRVGSAQSSREATLAQFALTRAQVRLQVESAYAQALAASVRADLTRATRRAADSLVAMTRARRDAGDASDLDVDLAAVEAAQLASAFVEDSLSAGLGVLEVQRLMGLRSDTAEITLADSLAPMADAVVRGTATGAPSSPLRVRAAEMILRALEDELALARRRRWLVPSLTAGFDVHEPGVPGNRLLPTIGLSVPVPLFNRYHGDVRLAEAGRDRAQVELEAARRDVAGTLRQAQATLQVALARLALGREAAALAQRVAERALLAYAEGEAALPYVLQAERSAREARAQAVDAQAGAVTAGATIRFLATGADR
jgi:outer membrane protein, heavy metal efflux system